MDDNRSGFFAETCIGCAIIGAKRECYWKEPVATTSVLLVVGFWKDFGLEGNSTSTNPRQIAKRICRGYHVPREKREFRARCCVEPHFVLDIDNNRVYTTALGQRLLAGAPGCGPANQVHAMLARGLTAGAAGQ